MESGIVEPGSPPAPLTIDVFADVITPWSYIGKRRLESALRMVGDRVEAEVRWRPFQLDPATPTGGVDRRADRARRYGHRDLADAADALVVEAARADGLDLDLARIDRNPNTFDAHRLIALAGRAGGAMQDAVVEALFRAHLVEGRDLGDRATLAAIAAAAGLDVGRALDSDDADDEVRAGLARGRRPGVRVAPHAALDGWSPLPLLVDPATIAAALARHATPTASTPAPAPAPDPHGFERTRCGCDFCRAYCRHAPGRLAPGDLERLVPAGADPFAWAERHLRALTGRPYPRLVPAPAPGGACHWYDNGRCAVHEAAPFGCAYFDAHMPPAEVERRSRAASQASLDDDARDGLHVRVWRHLLERGLVIPPADRAALHAEQQLLRRSIELG